MKFIQSFNLKALPYQMMESFFIAKETIPFIRKHKLWKGFLKHKWILILFLLVSIIFSYSVLGDLRHFLGLSNELIPDVANSSLLPDMGDVKEAVESQKRTSISNGTKYLLLIVLEVVIFYFSVKTVNAVTERYELPGFKEFLRAEKRMIKIMVLNYIKGVIAHAFLYTVLAIVGKTAWVPFIMFFVYAYFIGYAFLDNYNEIFVTTIKRSDRIIRFHAGAAMTFGILVSLLLHIPLIGPIFAPILGSIAGAIYGNRNQIQNLFDLVPVEEDEFI